VIVRRRSVTRSPARLYGDQVHVIALVERHPLGRLADENGAGPDHRLDDPDLVGGLVGLRRAMFPTELEARRGHDPLERDGLAFEEEEVVLADHRIGKRLGAALLVADESRHLDLVLGQSVEVRDGPADHFRVRPDPGLRNVVLDVERHVEGRRAPAPAGEQAVAEGEEDDPGRRDAEAHGGEVEHAERGAGELASDPRHDDVRRGADEGHESPEKRAERHGHQEGRRRGVGPARHLERDRHHHRERADVLHESRENRHAPDQNDDLHLGGGEVGRCAVEGSFKHAGLGDRGADEKRARDDDHDVVGEALKGLVGRDDPDEHGGEERNQGYEVVAQAPPHEERHHAAEDGEGQDLGEGHGRPHLER